MLVEVVAKDENINPLSTKPLRKINWPHNSIFLEAGGIMNAVQAWQGHGVTTCQTDRSFLRSFKPFQQNEFLHHPIGLV